MTSTTSIPDPKPYCKWICRRLDQDIDSAKRVPLYGKLVFLDDCPLDSHVYPLEYQDYIIGREKECHLRITYPTVSRCHCIISYEDETPVLVNKSGLNGTYVDGDPALTKTKLVHGAMIKIGVHEFRFDSADAEFANTVLEEKEDLTSVSPIKRNKSHLRVTFGNLRDEEFATKNAESSGYQEAIEESKNLVAEHSDDKSEPAALTEPDVEDAEQNQKSESIIEKSEPTNEEPEEPKKKVTKKAPAPKRGRKKVEKHDADLKESDAKAALDAETNSHESDEEKPKEPSPVTRKGKGITSKKSVEVKAEANSELKQEHEPDHEPMHESESEPKPDTDEESNDEPESKPSIEAQSKIEAEPETNVESKEEAESDHVPESKRPTRSKKVVHDKEDEVKVPAIKGRKTRKATKTKLQDDEDTDPPEVSPPKKPARQVEDEKKVEAKKKVTKKAPAPKRGRKKVEKEDEDMKESDSNTALDAETNSHESEEEKQKEPSPVTRKGKSVAVKKSAEPKGVVSNQDTKESKSAPKSKVKAKAKPEVLETKEESEPENKRSTRRKKIFSENDNNEAQAPPPATKGKKVRKATKTKLQDDEDTDPPEVSPPKKPAKPIEEENKRPTRVRKAKVFD